jgi:hypothetical protein
MTSTGHFSGVVRPQEDEDAGAPLRLGQAVDEYGRKAPDARLGQDVVVRAGHDVHAEAGLGETAPAEIASAAERQPERGFSSTTHVAGAWGGTTRQSGPRPSCAAVGSHRPEISPPVRRAPLIETARVVTRVRCVEPTDPGCTNGDPCHWHRSSSLGAIDLARSPNRTFPTQSEGGMCR